MRNELYMRMSYGFCGTGQASVYDEGASLCRIHWCRKGNGQAVLFLEQRDSGDRCMARIISMWKGSLMSRCIRPYFTKEKAYFTKNYVIFWRITRAAENKEQQED